MEIDARPVPPVVLAQWRAVLAQVPATQLQALALARPQARRGFRPGRVAPMALLASLQRELAQAAELPADLHEALRAASLAGELLSVLSEAALRRILPPLVALHGVEPVAASLLLDEREAARRLGFELLDAPPAEPEGPASDRATAARSALADALAPFLRHTRTWQSPDTGPVAVAGAPPDPVDPAAAATVGAPRRARPAADREQVMALRQARQRIRQLERERDEAAADRDRLRAALDGMSAERDRLAADLAATRARLADRETAFAAAVARETQARLDGRLLRWLAPAQAMADDAAALAEGDDLIAQAEALLAEQARIDRRHGLRSALREALARCRRAMADIQQAQAESLSPLPELATLRERLAARAAQLQRLLDQHAPSPPANPLLQRLAQRLADTPDLDGLAALRRSLGAMGSLGLLTPAERQQAHDLLRQAGSTAYARAGMHEGWTRARQRLAGLPALSLQAAIDQGEACTLVVDGHNVLHGLPHWFGPHHEQGQPGARARRALEEHLTGLALASPSLRIHLWFDGTEMNDHTRVANLRVHYSGGSGMNRADERIAAYLRHLQVAEPATARAVVSADRDIQLAAEQTGAMTLLPEEFEAWLADA
ncbi:MAG: NYN domain-containing protein [Betaproteobacteria bacterium]|nr:NYN domain-containing protein [Betaproteobacteria bacterium]